MLETPGILTSTLENATLYGDDTSNGRRRTHGSCDLRNKYDVWPRDNDRHFYHPYHDCKRIAADYEAEQEIARDFLLPTYAALGEDRDDPGALAMYEKHRIVERQIADKLYCDVAAYADSIQRDDLADQMRRTAIKLFQCRTGGAFGIGGHGRPVIAWDSKCGCSKLCPDEARHEAQRLYDRYAGVIEQHERDGGRVYKAWFTVPNAPPGELADGQRGIFRDFRNKIMRGVCNGRQKFGIDGALTILEAPLSEGREWNLHLNVIVLARGWLSYWKLRNAWGYGMEIRQHNNFSEKGLHALFNEMVKYSVRAVPEKSGSKHSTKAPAFIDWTPAELLEWLAANHNFRRTRAYGCLHGIGKPERPDVQPSRWLGRLDWHPDGYRVTWRDHNLGDIVNDMLRFGRHGLDLIRGDRSTENHGYNHATGPP